MPLSNEFRYAGAFRQIDLMDTIEKRGDFKGHPFRGNQWTRLQSLAERGIGEGFLNGGATIDIRGASIHSGYAVGVMPKESLAKKDTEFTLGDMKNWLKAHQKDLSKKDAAIGVWHDTDSHQMWLDVIHVYPSTPMGRKRAIAAGKAHNQIGIMHLDDLTFVPTYGDGVAKADRDLKIELKAPGPSAVRFSAFPADIDPEELLAWISMGIGQRGTQDIEKKKHSDAWLATHPNHESSPKEIVGHHGHRPHGPSIKWPALYEHLKAKGYKKSKAAAISNAAWNKKHTGRKTNSTTSVRGAVS